MHCSTEPVQRHASPLQSSTPVNPAVIYIFCFCRQECSVVGACIVAGPNKVSSVICQPCNHLQLLVFRQECSLFGACSVAVSRPSDISSGMHHPCNHLHQSTLQSYPSFVFAGRNAVLLEHAIVAVSRPSDVSSIMCHPCNQLHFPFFQARVHFACSMQSSWPTPSQQRHASPLQSTASSV